MNYIIFDLEFNQKFSDSSDVESIKNPKLPFEIIQIGALKLNENFQAISEFNALVKPTVYPIIHPYIENLTKITNEKVSSCNNFVQVYEDFKRFVGEDETVLCVWGMVDIKELLRNIKYFNFPTPSFSKYFIDIQRHASRYLKVPKQAQVGLRTAIELLNIPIDGEFHDAFYDAYYTAEVFKKIYDDSIKPSIYSPNSPKRISQPKENVDTAALIKQFEKMYDREMTKEEQAIIKLAYTMGRTRQFIK